MSATKVIGIPASGTVHVHKATCRDIGTYHGLTYDDCYHIEAATKAEVVSQLPEGTEVVWFPCTKALRKA